MDVRTKTPTAELLYTFQFARTLGAGETISSPAVAVDYPADYAGFTVGAPVVSGTDVQVLVGGGTAGKLYVLTCRVTSSGGQKPTVQGAVAVKR